MTNPIRALLCPAATIPFPRDVLSSQLLAIGQLAASRNMAAQSLMSVVR